MANDPIDHSSPSPGNWIEVWYDPTTQYLLVLAPHPEGGYRVYDPREQNREVYRTVTYDEARLWLRDDEYEIVNGRFFDE